MSLLPLIQENCECFRQDCETHLESRLMIRVMCSLRTTKVEQPPAYKISYTFPDSKTTTALTRQAMLWEGVGRIQTIQMLLFKQHKMLGISKTSLTLNKVLCRCLGQMPQRLD